MTAMMMMMNVLPIYMLIHSSAQCVCLFGHITLETEYYQPIIFQHILYRFSGMVCVCVCVCVCKHTSIILTNI